MMIVKESSESLSGELTFERRLSVKQRLRVKVTTISTSGINTDMVYQSGSEGFVFKIGMQDCNTKGRARLDSKTMRPGDQEFRSRKQAAR